MAWYEIPLDTTPDNEFGVTVEANEENIALMLHVRYNSEGDFWSMDVRDGNSGEMLLAGVPLLTGEYPSADILRQFGYIGIGSAIVVKVSDAAEGDYPGIENLGTDYVLVWGSEDEG